MEEDFFTEETDGYDPEAGEIPDNERDWLYDLLETSSYEEKVRVKLRARIAELKTLDELAKAKFMLLTNQVDLFNRKNPSARQIKEMINKKVENNRA